MRKIAVVAVLAVAFAWCGLAFAFDNEPEGFRGLKWGDPPGEDMKLLYSAYSELDMFCYERKDDKMQIGGAKLKSITYHYYEDRFMMVEIKLERGDYDALEEVLRLKFGDPVRKYRVIFAGCKTEWEGDTAMIVLTNKIISQLGRTEIYEGVLEIFSTEIHSESEEELPLKREEQRRKRDEERQKAAEEGLDDF